MRLVFLPRKMAKLGSCCLTFQRLPDSVDQRIGLGLDMAYCGTSDMVNLDVFFSLDYRQEGNSIDHLYEEQN